jgi:Mitochondrial carrier protein
MSSHTSAHTVFVEQFFTYNWLSTSEWVQNLLPSLFLRNAGIGLTASVVSDTVVNAIRVVKTTKQSLGSKHAVTYGETIRMILAADGWKGLFGRGLRTRILANALQSIVFTIIWRGLAERWSRKATEKDRNKS